MQLLILVPPNIDFSCLRMISPFVEVIFDFFFTNMQLAMKWNIARADVIILPTSLYKHYN